ncbi:hypothetical protein AB0M36_05635 [Actinoplanes sp. NPDC051346]|uniref:hypothetical protein n=1 Tax=Actinoplanes sp. NPDC051346 TaxID=3155048 RepID=UPI0034330F13
MNLTQLRDVLDERSATDHSDFPGHRMLDGVHHRLRIRRRRQQVAAAAAAFVAVAAVGVGTLVAPDHQRGTPTATPSTPPPTHTIEGFPEYDGGHRVIAAKTALPPAKSVSLTFTPTTITNLSFLTRCEGAFPHKLSLNGQPVSEGDQCSGFVTIPEPGKELRLAVGKPATVELTFTEGAPTTDFAVAVGVPVDPATYPYPPRPATLTPLELPTGNPDAKDPADRVIVLRSDPTNPLLPVSKTFTWPGTDVVVHANTPGGVTVTINGSKGATCRFWSYGLAGCGLGDGDSRKDSRGKTIRRGDTVTLTAVPDGTSGEWAVIIENYIIDSED